MFSSRSFTSNIMTVDAAGDPFSLLYPVIDIFNHKFGEKAHWSMEKGTFSLILPSGALLGQQIFNNYAPKGNQECRYLRLFRFQVKLTRSKYSWVMASVFRKILPMKLLCG